MWRDHELEDVGDPAHAGGVVVGGDGGAVHVHGQQLQRRRSRPHVHNASRVDNARLVKDATELSLIHAIFKTGGRYNISKQLVDDWPGQGGGWASAYRCTMSTQSGKEWPGVAGVIRQAPP